MSLPIVSYLIVWFLISRSIIFCNISRDGYDFPNLNTKHTWSYPGYQGPSLAWRAEGNAAYGKYII